MKILVINGPNLNMLGVRDKKQYGSNDYKYLLNLISDKAKELTIDIDTYQSNHEGDIVDRIQEALNDETDGIVINPGALTHYSISVRDALEILHIPKVEVHISDISTREDFRHISVTKDVCDKQIVGKGLDGYIMAIEYIYNILIK